MSAAFYGCHNRAPYAASYTATGSAKPILHVLSRDCKFTLTALGQADAKCVGCVWRKGAA